MVIVILLKNTSLVACGYIHARLNHVIFKFNIVQVLKIGSKLEVSDGHLSDRLKFWAETIPNLFTKKERKAKKEAVKDEL